MQKDRIVVENVYKYFDIYMDKANSLKEKMLFWRQESKHDILPRNILEFLKLLVEHHEEVYHIGQSDLLGWIFFFL